MDDQEKGRKGDGVYDGGSRERKRGEEGRNEFKRGCRLVRVVNQSRPGSRCFDWRHIYIYGLIYPS